MKVFKAGKGTHDTVLTRVHTLLEWAFREQLALAAIDVGRLDVADVRVQSPLIALWLTDPDSKYRIVYAT